MPADAGLVLTVKTHGHTVGEGTNVPRERQPAFNDHEKVNNTAILLIRNPFRAIIGYLYIDYAYLCFC